MSVPLLKKGLLGGGSKILLFLRPNQLSLNLFPKTTGILGMEFVPFVIISIKTKKMCDNFPPLSFFPNWDLGKKLITIAHSTSQSKLQKKKGSCSCIIIV